MGGLIEALMGQTDFRAQSPRISTKPGEAAIAGQLNSAAQQAAGMGYGLAAGSRGPGTALALREAQRRGSQAIMGAGNQAAIQSQQLQQAAMQQQAQQFMQAQQINAGIEQQNAAGVQKLAGAAVAGLAMSDERSKTMGTGQPRVLWTSPNAAGPMGQRQAAYRALEDERMVARNAQLAQVPMAPAYQTTVASSAHPYAPPPATAGGPTAIQRFGTGFSDYYLSDERAKKLEDENAALKDIVQGRQIQIQQPEFAVAEKSRLAPGLVQPMAPGIERAKAYGDFGSFTPEVRQQIVDSTRGIPDLQVGSQQRGTAVRDISAHLAARQKALQDYDLSRRAYEAGQMAPPPPDVVYLRDASGGPGATVGGTQNIESNVLGMRQPQPLAAPPMTARNQRAMQEVVASDERSKSSGMVDHLQFPRGVEPVAFHYKPGMGDGPDQHYGVLAQDLEKSKEGRTTVKEEPSSGMKMVDTNRLTMLNTAKLAEMEHRLRKAGV